MLKLRTTFHQNTSYKEGKDKSEWENIPETNNQRSSINIY